MSCGLCDTKTRRCDRGSRVLSVARCIYGRETKFMRHVASASCRPRPRASRPGRKTLRCALTEV